MEQTVGFEASLRRRQFELGQISRSEYEEGEEPKYSSKSVILSRRAIRSRYQTMGEKHYREIRLK